MQLLFFGEIEVCGSPGIEHTDSNMVEQPLRNHFAHASDMWIDIEFGYPSTLPSGLGSGLIIEEATGFAHQSHSLPVSLWLPISWPSKRSMQMSALLCYAQWTEPTDLQSRSQLYVAIQTFSYPWDVMPC